MSRRRSVRVMLARILMRIGSPCVPGGAGVLVAIICAISGLGGTAMLAHARDARDDQRIEAVLAAGGPDSGSEQRASREEPDRKDIGSSGRVIELPPQVTLQDLVELAVRESGRSVEFRADELRGTVSLRLQRPVSADELWALTASTLEAQGLVFVTSGVDGVWRIVPMARAAAGGIRPRTREPGDLPEGYSTVLIDLVHLSAEEAIGVVRPALTPAHSTAIAIGPRRILISDAGSRLASAMQLIAMAEDVADPVERLVVPLRHQPAERVVETVGRLLGMPGRGAARPPSTPGAAAAEAAVRLEPLPDGHRLVLLAPRSRTQEVVQLLSLVDVPDAGVVRSYSVPGMEASELAEALRTRASVLLPGAGEAAGESRLQIIQEKSTNSVFVRGPLAVIDGLSEFIDEIVRTRPDLREELRFFVIRNRDAEEIRGVLERILEDRPRFAAEKGADAETGVAMTEIIAPASLRLSVDVSTNTLIAAGPAPMLRRLEGLLRTLDTQQPQVMIEVTLVTVNESRSLNLGVELETQFRNGRTTTNLASAFGLGTGDLFAPGTGLTGLVLRPGDFEVLVRAVEATGAGRSLSVPRILVNNNASTSLRSVVREPFTSINASATVATTSFGGTQDAGTSVTVRPQIAPGDHLTIEYSIELSSFTGSSTTTEGGGVIPPATQVNSLEGKATIPDSFTVVAGGLRINTDGRSRTQVPLLGGIPLLGLLFGSQGEDASETRFYVFLRGTILRDGNFKPLHAFSERDRRGAGLASDAPAVSPLWMH